MLKKVFPFLSWLKGYNIAALRLDFVAGLTVALVLIPQSMAYAQLAGLPPWYGLYASFLPPMLAALFGSSRQLATGPVAVVSLMTSASLAPLATAGGEQYIAYAILLALMVGLFQFLLGVLRLGLVVNFLSHPVVNGFTNAAALIIATSQLSKLFNVYVDEAEHHYETIYRVIKAAVQYTHWPTFILGMLALALMYGIKRINPRIPYVLIAVVITTAIAWATGYEHNDRKVALSSIQSPQVQAMVKDFNSTVKKISDLAADRTRLTAEMDEAVKANGAHSIKALEAKHRLEVVELEMAEAKEMAGSYRTSLRKVRCARVNGADGNFHFLPAAEVQSGAATDGRVWRVRVGNSPIKEDAMTLMGGGAVVGEVPKGLPMPVWPKLDLKVILKIFPFAAVISLLGFMEAISIAKAMAAKTGQRLDPNQELIGQGVANMAGALFKSYPTSGSFSRSAVNLQSGAVTGLSSVFTSLAVVIVLLFFTPLLYHLPQSVLAAIIMMAVIGLLNVSGFIHAWKAQWYDGAISIISFVSTLAFAPHLDKGIMVGVVLSLGVFLYKSMRPRVATLSMYKDRALRDAAYYGLRECEHIAVVRFDGPLFFANASFLEDQITERIQNKPKLRHILIVANGINDMDASGEEALSLMVDRVRSAGFDLSLSGVNENVMSVLKRTHLYERIGEDHIFPTQMQAMEAIHHQTHLGSEEKECPLTIVCLSA